MTDYTAYSALTLVDALDAFASNEPVPGGGSAAALAGALGVSLLLMAAGIARTKTGAPEETADLAQAAARLRPLRDTLTTLIDEDAAAYTSVMAALRLPKASDAEKTARTDALAAALRTATETPLDTMRACQQALRGAVVVAGAASQSAASDVGVAVELLLAASRGAGLNVDTNLSGLTDAEFADRVRRERVELAEESATDAARAQSALST